MNPIVNLERRAAIDIGSGTSKLVVADFDIARQGVLKVVYADFVNILFSDALLQNPHNIFDEELYKQAVTGFKRLFDLAQQAGALKCVAIATAAFRKAANGVDFIERLSRETKIPIIIIAQEEEAMLGFETAVQSTGHEAEKVISWDSGSGSIQLTAKTGIETISYLVPFGTTSATQLLSKITENRASAEDAKRFLEHMEVVLPQPSETFRNKIIVPEIAFIGIGSAPSTMGVCARACQKSQFTAEELWIGILGYINASEEVLSRTYHDTSVKTVLPRLLLTYSVMKALNVERLEWTETNGNCLGVFCLQDKLSLV
jgi:exopolyphosphatase/guanosine-5'-triphosphate,3'-diphosphate pyrophosphatase